MPCSNSSDLVYILLVATSAISLISCCAIITVYLRFKELRSFSLRIVLYMTISDFLRSLIYLIPIYRPSYTVLCKIDAFLYNTLYLVNVSWAVGITYMLYQSIVYFNDSFEKYRIYWLFFNYIVIPLVQALPFITDSYGDSTWICTLHNDKTGVIWRMVIEILPVWVSIFAMVYMYYRIYAYLSRVDLITVKELMLEKGMVYPVIIIITFLPLSTFRILAFFMNSCELFALALVVYALISLHGFFNFIALMLNQSIRSLLGELLERRQPSEDSIKINDSLFHEET